MYKKMLELAGESLRAAAADAQTVLRIETELAKGSLDRVSRRDPNQTYHKMSVKELAALSPSIDWPKYFAGMGTPSFTDLDVSVPGLFQSAGRRSHATAASPISRLIFAGTCSTPKRLCWPRRLSTKTFISSAGR